MGDALDKRYQIFRDGRLYDSGQGVQIVTSGPEAGKASSHYCSLQHAIGNARSYADDYHDVLFEVRDLQGECHYQCRTSVRELVKQEQTYPTVEPPPPLPEPSFDLRDLYDAYPKRDSLKIPAPIPGVTGDVAIAMAEQAEDAFFLFLVKELLSSPLTREEIAFRLNSTISELRAIRNESTDTD